jgi:hypothetical protein
LRRELELKDLQILKLKNERDKQSRSRQESFVIKMEEKAKEKDAERLKEAETRYRNQLMSRTSSNSSLTRRPPPHMIVPEDEEENQGDKDELEIELADLTAKHEDLRKRHFFLLGWSIKTSLLESGKFCNVKVGQLYEHAQHIPDAQV